MTPEQLDMYKRLQPLYKRVMGEWKVGDRIHFNSHQAIITQLKDIYIYAEFENEDKFFSRDTMEFANDNFTRIPLTIDSEKPERGLWGMLSKENWMKMCVKVLDTGVFSYMLPREGRMDWCIDNPTTAILKVLCEQEGV